MTFLPPLPPEISLAALLRFRGRGLRGRGTCRNRRAHLYQHVVGADGAGCRRDRALVAVVIGAVHGVLEDLDLGIFGPNLGFGVGGKRLRPIAGVGIEPRLVLVLFQHVLQECLCGVGILAVLEQHRVQRQARHRRDLGEALRQQLVLAVFGDRAGRRIVLQREIQRDAVGGQRDFLRGIGAVVADVVPRRRAGDEGRVQFLDPVQRGDGLLAVDDDVTLFIEQGSVVRPQRPFPSPLALPSAKPAGLPAFCSLRHRSRIPA